MEAERALGNGADGADESFRTSVRESRAHVGEYSLDVLFDGACNATKRRESRARCPSDPVEELVAGDVALLTVEDGSESLFEKVRR